jgi:hypothetical protein
VVLEKKKDQLDRSCPKWGVTKKARRREMSNKKQQQQKANWIGRICVELPSKTRH